MVITNGLVFNEDCVLVKADLAIEGDRIARLAPAGSLPAGNALDAMGGFVLPGFVDIHTHGAVNADFSDGDGQGIQAMLAYYGSVGVTSVIGTTVTGSAGTLRMAVDAMAPLLGASGHGAVLRGIRLEGPFLSPAKSGAQDPESLLSPDGALFDELYALAEGGLRMIDIAPDLPGAADFIRRTRMQCVVSLAHSPADYDTAAAGFAAGATHVGHLFNAMAPFGHRQPGLVGAAFDFADHVEVISDGEHLHPSVVRGTFPWFGKRRVCLVSDSMRATGLSDGNYTLGGLAVRVRRGRATLEDGTLAGSVTDLAECCRRAVGFGVPFEKAVRAATLNPAQAVGIENEVGSLMPGKRADVLIWDRDLHPLCVISGGEMLRDLRLRH